MGLEDAKRPDDDWPEDDSPDPDWPDDWPEGDPAPPWPGAAPPWPGGPPGAARAGGPRRGRGRALAIAAVAVVALGAGAGITAALSQGLSSSPVSVSPTTAPPAGQPGGGGVFPGGQGGGPAGGPGGGATLQMFIGGKVTAVSSTSITISGGTHTVTAAITGATRVTGKVTSIASVKVGDFVSAQITQSNGQSTALSIQDPASMPQPGGGQP